MEALKNLPIGIQTFERLRKDNYIYVDKTALVYQLVATGRYYFLSRPRRFGKSMLLSTLKAYFEGKKALFDGLVMAGLEKDWTQYPVLHLDLNLVKRGEPDTLDMVLNNALRKWEKVYGLEACETSLGLRFQEVIERAHLVTGHPVVILVDEYDKPIIEEIDNPQVQERQQETLKQFYGVLKNMDNLIKFVLLTGVTKFSKVSVFSGLNNIEDISLSEDYATLCGITDEEIDTTLAPYVHRLAAKLGLSVEKAREELRSRYDGYHFSKESIGVYNPFSLLNALKNRALSNYWFETGTPSHLVHLLQKHHCNLEKMAAAECDAEELNSTDSQSTNPISVIYQSGYLTIKSFDPEFETYTLGFPNKEVEDGFLKYLLPNYSSVASGQTGFFISNFVREIRAGKVDDFLRRLSSLFADTPYELIKDLENHYQNVMFIVGKLMGLYVNAEYHTSQGRIDLVIQTSDYVYVMEFKLDGTAEEAIAQINDKGYARQFAADSRHLLKIGVNFSATTRNIERWIVE
jgi:hypothetical protein